MESKEPFAPLIGFESRKAAQVAAYFALCAGGEIEKLKLTKLLYLAERESMQRHDHPMFYDEFYSLKDGPVCSSALNGINGVIDPATWEQYLARSGNIIVPVKRFTRDDLDEVSNAEVAILDSLWGQFGKMSSGQIRQHTHDHCPEYTEVTKGRLPIQYVDVFKALGKDNADNLAESVSEVRRVESLLST